MDDKQTKIKAFLINWQQFIFKHTYITKAKFTFKHKYTYMIIHQYHALLRVNGSIETSFAEQNGNLCNNKLRLQRRKSLTIKKQRKSTVMQMNNTLIHIDGNWAICWILNLNTLLSASYDFLLFEQLPCIQDERRRRYTTEKKRKRTLRVNESIMWVHMMLKI